MKSRACFLLLLLMTLASSANTVSAQSAALQVEIYDYARLKPVDLHELITRMQEILASSGVSLQVDLCAKAHCENHTGSPRQLVIRVVPDAGRYRKNPRLFKLGMSVANHEGGTYATVFLKPAEEEASDANLPPNIVLAYAAVHEIGHLLLGDQAHTQRGLMKATWDSNDFKAMAQKSLHFSPDQIRELTSRYGTAHRAEVGADKELAVAH